MHTIIVKKLKTKLIEYTVENKQQLSRMQWIRFLDVLLHIKI